MDGSTSGFIAVVVNGNSGLTIDVYDYPQSQWNFIQYPWTAPAGTTSTTIFVDWYGPAGRLDAITLAPVSAYCGANPPLGIMPDGEFECGFGAWTQQVSDSSTTAGLKTSADLTPGNQNVLSFGQYFWMASTSGPNHAQQELGVSARLISPTVPVMPGKSYMLVFTAYFSNQGIGFIGVKINGVSVMTRDPSDRHVGTGWFAMNQYFWVAPAGVTTAKVTFEAAFAGAGTMAVDSVILVEAAQN